MELRFVDAENTDLLELAGRLDEYYFSIVGEVHRCYAKYNDPHLFGCRLVVYEDGCASGCGCWKRTDAHTVELKRIYVRPEYRRRGIAGAVIRALEGNAAEQGYTRAVLETARTTGDSAALYRKLGYRTMPYYGSPAGAENCLCFEKALGTVDKKRAALRFVDVSNPDLAVLVAELDVYFHAGWGSVAEKCKAYHALDGMACAVVAYIGERPAKSWPRSNGTPQRAGATARCWKPARICRTRSRFIRSRGTGWCRISAISRGTRSAYAWKKRYRMARCGNRKGGERDDAFGGPFGRRRAVCLFFLPCAVRRAARGAVRRRSQRACGAPAGEPVRCIAAANGSGDLGGIPHAGRLVAEWRGTGNICFWIKEAGK